MNQPETDTLKTTETLKVLYDGDCPMCRKEIEHIQGLAEKNSQSNLCFIDISCDTPETTPYAEDKKKLLARFHVEKIDGSRLDGAKAFVAMWERLPGWRWLAKFSKIPGMLILMELAYRIFLRIRPAIQWLIRRWIK